MTGRKYLIYDVFTRTRLAGNQLAIVIDGEGLETQAMQAIAREFNLSETVFVTPAENPAHAAAVRIFMPQGELPFAGHPTVGTAVALAGEEAGTLVLEEKIGPVRCTVERGEGAAFAAFDLPRLPEPADFSADSGAIAAALGLAPDEIGFSNHVPSLWSAGVPYLCVPVAGLEAAGSARIDARAWTGLALRGDGQPCAPYLYCRETVGEGCAFHARMFAPWDGIPEDPATGSAAAAFAGAVMRFDEPGDGVRRLWIEQGVEMGRPSRIRLELDVAGGALKGARIGGHAVKVAEGTLLGL